MKQVFFGFFIFSLFLFAYPATLFAKTAPVSNPGGLYSGVTEKPVLFDGSASSGAVTYSWDFGDGIAGTGRFSSHAYARTGTFTITLTVSNGTATDTQATSVTILLRPPATPSPETGVPFVPLPLVLGWGDVPRAQSYRYEFIGYEENGRAKEFLVIQSQSDTLPPDVLKFLEPQHPAPWYQELNKCDKNGDGKCTDSEIRTFIKDQQKHLWHARSCEDTEGTTCGPWGEPWDFTYLLGPAVLKTPVANATLPIPITFDWDDMPGAKSYELATGPCPSWMQDSGAVCYSLPITTPRNGVLVSEYKDTPAECLFTRNSRYDWRVASCLDEQASFCTHPDDFSSRSFSTSASAPPLSAPTLLGPLVKKDAPPRNPVPTEDIPSVSKSDVLRWSGDACAYFYRVNVFNEAGTRITENNCPSSGSACTKEVGEETLLLKNVERLWDQSEDFDKTYSWSVTPCWSSMNPLMTPLFPPGAINYDCTNTTDSLKWYFHTTGRPPALLTPTNNSSTKIPVVLTWERVGGAGSYRYQVAKDARFTQISKEDTARGTSIEVAYTPSNIIPGTPYWWRVKTCVDEEGTACGSWSNAFQFVTFPLNAPSIPTPPNDGSMLLTDAVRWDSISGANFYQYHLEYACRDEKETSARCPYKTQVGVCPADGSSPTTPSLTIEEEKVVSSNSFYLPYCMGKYRWAVRSCLDKSCSVAEPALLRNAAIWTLSAFQPPLTGVGLVPCGKPSNEPTTPYDETDSCGLKHAGFLLQNLLDFILWKVSLFVLLVLAVITGATSYFSLGGPNALARVKTVFSSFFAGFLVLVFAWMLINIALVLFGFRFEFFGRWWELSF